MHRLLLICGLILGLQVDNLAQQLGIKGGINFTNASADTDLELSTSNGFHAGVGFEFPVISFFNIGSGLYYTLRGYKSNEAGREGNVSIDYLDIPVDLMFKIGLSNVVEGFVSAGPYFSYGLSSKVFDVNGVLQNGYDKEDIDLNRIDSGINLGAGVDISRIRVSASYGISITNNGSIATADVKNRVLKLSLGFFFY